MAQPTGQDKLAAAQTGKPKGVPTTHPLLPGIVGRGIGDPNWTRTQHDALATGFSPWVCNMRKAPAVWAEMKAGGSLNSIAQVSCASGKQCLLVDDGRFRLVSPVGEVIWTRSAVGQLLKSGDLRTDGGHYGLFSGGRRLSLLNLDDGTELWHHLFEPAHVGINGKVADILPDRPGMEAAIFLVHGEEACLINFPPHSLPTFVWQQKVVDGEFNERYDHYNGTFQIDLSVPDEPVLWNLRRHRCRGFDARTGERISTLTYDIGGAQRRNYGPMYLGRGRNGEQLACVFGQSVQVHAHAIRLHRDRDNELAWQHYYGEVYKEAPGVTLEALGVADVDGDGGDEMVYTVRDPARDFRSFVRARAADTGEIVFELPDHWGIGIFSGVGPDASAGLLAISAAEGRMPQHGQLRVHRFVDHAIPELLNEFDSAGTWGPVSIATDQNNELLIRETADGRSTLSQYTIESGELRRTERTAAAPLLAGPIHQVLENSSTEEADFLLHRGEQLQCVAWDGKTTWRIPLQGIAAPAVSAADLDNDGRAELVAAMQDKRMRVFAIAPDGKLHERNSYEHLIGWHCHHPVVFDLLGDGQLCLLTAGDDDRGQLVIRAHGPNGDLLWESTLEVSAEQLRAVVLNAGYFFAEDHAGVAVSITDSRLVHEGTFMLDGRNGNLRWFKGLYRKGNIIMPYRPNGIPIAYDLEEDGVEEIGMDMLSYMAFLRGADGEFSMLHPTSNIGAKGAVYAGKLYNTYCPLWKQANDSKPHWFVTAGFGPFGLMNPDPRSGVWREDLDYDVPLNIALVDVDGDGELEAGYAARNDANFVCRDVWTGEVEWTLELPSPVLGATITADFDGDGRGEYFCGRYCIGVNDEGVGQLHWQSPVHLTWPIVADFDGDGVGEIGGGVSGGVVILDGAGEQASRD